MEKIQKLKYIQIDRERYKERDQIIKRKKGGEGVKNDNKTGYYKIFSLTDSWKNIINFWLFYAIDTSILTYVDYTITSFWNWASEGQKL